MVFKMPQDFVTVSEYFISNITQSLNSQNVILN